MGGKHTLLQKIEKYIIRGFLGTTVLAVMSVGVFTYALSDSFIRSQVDYLIGVIDANIKAQNLDENSAKNVYIGMRNIYRGAIAVLDERIGDTQVPPQCLAYTDPVERAICESNQGGSTGSGTTGNTCNDITLSNNQIWGGCDILDQAYGTNICPAGYNIPTAGQWSKLIDSFPGTYVAKLTLGKQYYWTSTNSNNTQEKLLLYIKNDTGSDQLINPGLMTNKISVRCIKDGSATTSNGQPNPAYTDIPPAPIPYQKNYRKTCEGILFEGANRVQNYRWYDTEGKPQDLVQKCSQPNRVNGGLICSESANGCCPTGQIAINGTCITPADVGGSCYATSGCKDGLSCNSNKVCVGSLSSGTGGTGGGSGSTSGTPIVSAMVTGIASTTSPGTFTNKAPQGTSIQLQYNSSNVGNTISFQIFRGTGPLDNSNLASGTNYVQYANLPGNTSGTFNIPLQNLAIGTYRIVVTGCNGTNQCVPTPAVLFEVIASGGGTSGTGGNTGGGTGTSIACTGGNQVNFSSNGKNCVSIMPVGPTLNYQTTVNATQGQGTAVVKCTTTGWTVVTPNCTVDKNASGTGNTGGGTGGTTSTSAPPGYRDISCPSGINSIYWPCGTSSLNEYNPPGCGVDRMTQYKNESFYTSTSTCLNGTKPLSLRIDRTTNTVTWYCTNDTNQTSVQCKGMLNVDAACGTAAGMPAPLDTYSFFQTSNTSLCKAGVLGVISPGGIGGTGIYTIENNVGTDTNDINYYKNANYAYKCDGIGAGASITCRTGKVNIVPECGAGGFACKGGFVKKIPGEAQDQFDVARFKTGNLKWNCAGLDNGAEKTVTCSIPAAGQNPVCSSVSALQSLGSIQYFNPGTNASLSYDFNPFLLCDMPRNSSFGAVGSDAGKFIVQDDLIGTDGQFNWKCKGIDRFGNPTSETVTCGARRIFPGECGTNNGLTLNTVDPDSSFYQTWGASIVLKYCAKGYPTYTDNAGTDGAFDWYCAFPDSTKTYCSANKTGGGGTTGTPVTGLCSYPSVKNTCMTGAPEVINNCTSDEKSTWKCKGSNNGSDSSTCYVNNPGCGYAPPAYTYSWSYANNPNWGSCAGNCGPANGRQSRTAQCLRNDGVVSPGNCSGTAPSENQACTVPSSSCTPLSCAAGSMTKTSPDNSNTCNFSWQSITGGNSKTVTLSDGSTAQGYCNTDGTWGNWDITCKNAVSAPVSCAGGGRPFTSVDGSNTCYANYDQKNAGQSVTIGNGLTISGGGQGSATCSSGGYWTYSVYCPGQTLSCPTGSGDLPAVNGDPACVAYYPATAASAWGSGTTNLGGWIRGKCNPDGTWDANSITFDCKP